MWNKDFSKAPKSYLEDVSYTVREGKGRGRKYTGQRLILKRIIVTFVVNKYGIHVNKAGPDPEFNRNYAYIAGNDESNLELTRVTQLCHWIPDTIKSDDGYSGCWSMHRRGGTPDAWMPVPEYGGK